MKIAVISFVVMFLNINFSNVFAEKLNNTFRVDKQSEGYRLGWNLSWAEKCNYYGYYNKFWKLYKKILATNNPQFEGVKQGWSYGNRADESTGCSEKVLKQLLTNTENLLNNSGNKPTNNVLEPHKNKSASEICRRLSSLHGEKNREYNSLYSEALKRGLDCYMIYQEASDIDICTKKVKLSLPSINESYDNEITARNLDCSTFIAQEWSNDFVCSMALNNNGKWDSKKSSIIYVKEAKRRGLSCGVNENKEKAINTATSQNKITNKTKDAENKCTEIGFTKGTEKYGDCVLKMLELK